MNRSDVSRFLVPCLAVAVATLTGTACAPVFSDLHGARLLPPGKLEVTPSASGVFASGEDGGHLQDHLGLQVAGGVAPGVELRGRVERVEAVDYDGGTNMFGAGPKVSIVRDRVAVFVPVGFAAGGGLEIGATFTLAPTVLATWPLAEGKADLNLSGKFLVPLHGEDRDGLAAVNVGLALGPHIERWAIRPEVGLLFNPGEEGHCTQFSLGISYSTP